MKLLIFAFLLMLGLTACDQGKEAADDTARELTGSNMLEQKKAVDKRIERIEQQQAERMEQMEQ